MLARIPSRLLTEWMAFEAIDPFEDRRGDLRSAQIVTALANINRDPKTRKEPYRIEEFVMRFDPHPDPLPDGERENRQTWQEQKARLMALMPPPPQPSPVAK